MKPSISILQSFKLQFLIIAIFNTASLVLAEDLLLDQITVTSDPNQQQLTSIPSSVSVIPSSSLQKQNTSALLDQLPLIPNLNFSAGTNTPRFFQIRGIGELEQYEGAPNYSVGFYFDDIDLSGLASGSMTFDVSQLEVLRGPQGTAYGANALAGMMRLKTTEFSDSQSGEGLYSLGSDNFSGSGFAIGGKTSDPTVLYRASFVHEQQDGFRENDFLNSSRTNKRDSTQLYLKVRKIFSSESKLDLSLLRIDQYNGYDAFSIDNSFHTQSDRPGRDTLEVTGSSAKLTNKINKDVQLNLISSFTTALQNYEFDGDWGNNAFWNQYAPYDYFSRSFRTRKEFWQEARLTDSVEDYKIGESSRFATGIYTQRLFEDTSNDNSSNGISYDTLLSEYSNTTLAVYGQRETALGSKSSLTTGIRLESKRAQYTDSRSTNASPEDIMLGGNISLQHELDKNLMSYALVSRGYRAGGVNSGLNIPSNQRTFDPEYLWNYELGLKSVSNNKKNIINLSFFYQKSIDSQIKGAYQLDPKDPLTFTYITDNIAQGDSIGSEIEASNQIFDRLYLTSSIGLIDTNINANANGLPNNRDRSHAPKYTFAVGPKYLITDNWYTDLQVTGKDAFYFDDSNNEKTRAYHLVNLSTGYETDRYRVSFWIKNLFDKKYAVRGFFFGNEPPDFPNKRYIQLGDPLFFGTSISVWF